MTATATLPMQIAPIGHIRSSVQLPPKGCCAKGKSSSSETTQPPPCFKRYAEQEAELVIQPELEELLHGIDEFSHLMVLYWPHLLDPTHTQQRKLHPMGRSDLPLCGVFATRTPGRPNPVLVTVVRLLARQGNILRVRGLEAVDGSPLIDIKPHTGNYFAEGEVTVPQWVKKLHEQAR